MHKRYPVTAQERDAEHGPSADTEAKLDAIYPRMHWLYYDGATRPVGDWRPTYYGLPADEPLIKPKGPTK